MSIDKSIAYLDGDAALPRKNGELVFAAPWEGRAFGLAVVLSDKGAYEWNDFRTRLVEQIGSADGPYYESWLAALERLLLARGVVTAEEIETRAHEYATLERDPVF